MVNGMWPVLEYFVIVVAVFATWTTVGCLGVVLMRGLLRALSALQERSSPVPRAIARRRIGV